ncbi:hypothetical protein [Butyrivibrio sp. WCD2001]|uniref:hypothetical protein n=1 Tax=Butyrivibrio sp. WCD2001 TaxID=1280681 RepID=UPI00042555C0|nr:hypothetical protein [Butyrivibrio sp. WCD2001]
MAAKRENYDNEILNLRAFYLTLLRKIWILPLFAVIGAVVAGIIYFLANVVYAPARNYVTESTLYLYFAYDENKGSEVDAYNAYTWNILVKDEDTDLPIKTKDNILDMTMENLEKAGYHEVPGVSRQVVKDSLNADIPSDVRVMILTVSNPDKELSGAIAAAAGEALVKYGDLNDAFTQIKLIGRTETKMELIPDRMGVAVILGALIGFIIATLGLLIIRSMDDTVYVPEDAERRYSLPVLGVLSSKGQEEPSFFRNELLLVFKDKFKANNKIALISADDKDGIDNAKRAAERLTEVIGNGLAGEMPSVNAMPLPGNDNESREKLSGVDGVIIPVKMGEHNGAMTEHLISLLNKLGCKIYGIVIVDADMKFLSRYLGL